MAAPAHTYITTGPVTMGACAQVALWGVLCSTFQTYHGTSAWNGASRPHRMAIWSVFILTTTATALSIHDIWFYSTLVTSDINVILTGTAPQAIEPLLTGFTSAMAQTALVLRGGRILQSQSRWRKLAYFTMTGWAILTSLLSCILVTAWSLEFHYDGGGDFIKLSFPDALAMWMWADAASSILVTLLYLLLLSRQPSSQTETGQTIVKRVVRLTLQSAGIPTLFAIVSATVNQATENNNLCFFAYAFWEPLTALYAISLFTTLTTGDKITREFGQEEAINEIKAGWSLQLSSPVDPAFPRSRFGSEDSGVQPLQPVASTSASPEEPRTGGGDRNLRDLV